MAFPVVAPTPSYSGTFIPEVWSRKLIDKYYDNTVLSQISNTDYEGEIRSHGDTVHIRTMPTLDIKEYKSGMTLVNQRPEAPTLELLIDKAFYWSAIIDDVQAKQSDLDQMNLWAQDAAEQMKLRLDSRVLGSVVPDFSAQNKGETAGRITGSIDLGVTGSPIGLTKANIIDYIVDLGQVLDEQNVPEEGRFLLMPFWATSLVKKSELKDASLAGDSTSIARNGRVGMVDRFTLFNSNLLPHYTDGSEKTFSIIAGHKDGLTFATQLTKVEGGIRSESTFGEIMRGLMVYGYKVVKPEALASLYAYKSTS